MPTPTTMEERFDEKWTRIEATMTGHISGRKIWSVDTEDEDGGYVFVDDSLKSFIQSEIDLVIAEERKRIVEMIREYAEPYDGSKWLNEVNAQKIINLITKQQ